MLQAAASRAGAWLPAGLQWGGACHGALGSTMQRAGLPATQLLSGPQQPQQQQQQWRCISEEQLNASQDHLQELFHRTLDNASRRKPQDGRPAFLTTRREALSLYREVLRYSNLFVWKDQQGRVWRDVIRQSTRKEFEDARIETDPEIVNRLIITGRDAVQRTVESFLARRRQIIEEEAAAQEAARRGGLSGAPMPPPPPGGLMGGSGPGGPGWRPPSGRL